MTEEEFRHFDQLHGVVGFLDGIKQENMEHPDDSVAGDNSIATASTATGGGRGRRKGSAGPASSMKKTP